MFASVVSGAKDLVGVHDTTRTGRFIKGQAFDSIERHELRQASDVHAAQNAFVGGDRHCR